MKSTEEEKNAQKINKILEAKMKECLANCKKEDMTPLLKARYDAFNEIFIAINKFKK